MADDAPVESPAVVDDQPVEQERDMRLDPDQLLEWGDTPLKAEERAENAEEAEEVVEPETPEEEEREVQPEEPAEGYETPAPALDLEDPGEYIRPEYSFDIEIDGKTVKVTSEQQAEELADEHAENLDARTIMKLLREGSKLEAKYEKHREEYDVKKTEYDAQKEAFDQQQEQVQSVAREITYLVAKGKLPAVDTKYSNANWADPEVAKQPGVKEQVELLTYMRTENDARSKAGLPALTSAIDAYNAWQLEQRDKQDVDDDKKKAAARKAAGARVAGSSSQPVNIAAPKGIAVGRIDMSLDDIDRF